MAGILKNENQFRSILTVCIALAYLFSIEERCAICFAVLRDDNNPKRTVIKARTIIVLVSFEKCIIS